MTTKQIIKKQEKRIKNVSFLKTLKKEIPLVGMGATQSVGSDSYPFTIVEVGESIEYIVIQQDDAKPTDIHDYYGKQDYTYHANPNAKKEKLTLRKNGYYVAEGELISRYFRRLLLGTKRKYSDPSF
jgi:hypothetical protein